MERFAEKTDLFRNQFIGVLSHDLRGPLGAVIAGAALLAVPEDNPQRRGRVVTRVMRSAQRMERMIGDLLDLTHARLGGTIPLKRRQADLQQSVRGGGCRKPRRARGGGTAADNPTGKPGRKLGR